MHDAQLTNKLSPHETVQPRCPMCQDGMEVLRVVPGRLGFENRTLRCKKCGLVQEAQAPADALNSDAMGWLDGSLKPPQ